MSLVEVCRLTRFRPGTLALAALALLPQGVAAEERPGAVMGWVEDRQGAPVAGALVSLFGKGLAGGSLVAVSDQTGRFSVPQLPAGSYTLRAITGDGMVAPPRTVTVLPNHHSLFTLSLLAAADAADALVPVSTRAERDSAAREWRWLTRHKKRTVLEDGREGVALAVDHTAHPQAEDALAHVRLLEGRLEVLASPAAIGDAEGTMPTSLGAVRLSGALSDYGRWSLGGLVAEAENDTWRMAAEFVIEPGGGHQIQIGSGYGSHVVPAIAPLDKEQDNRSVGAIFVEDRWQLDERTTATLGARYAYVGFVEDRHHLDPTFAVEFRPRPGVALRGGARTRTLTPGGDLLALSTLSATPAIAWALLSDELRPEKVLRYDLTAEAHAGGFRLRAHGFQESARDRLVNAFSGRGSDARLRILNGPGALARGAGLGVERRLGGFARASVDYTRGVAERAKGPAMLVGAPTGDFHDLVARLETAIVHSDTRIAVYYRVNSMRPEGDGERRLRTRFDLQLSQGLPYIGSLTRADWDLLFAFRNVFYEPAEGGFLDELAVIQPPRRMLGGVAVRF